MFERGTVFIVGAGGSYELGLPTGETLMGQIANVLTTSEQEEYYFTNASVRATLLNIARGRDGLTPDQEMRRFADAAMRLRRALPLSLSIDNLIDAHQNDYDMVLLGKVGIARVILEAEHESNLAAAMRGRPRQHEGAREYAEKSSEFARTWYPLLMRLLNGGIRREDVATIFANISIVTFNYDRCLEFFLFHALQSYYHLNDQEAGVIMRRLNIVHVYGSLGRMPWDGNGDVVPFGSLEPPMLRRAADRIRTFTETLGSDVARRAHHMVSSADTLVIMGFGFLPQNIRVIESHGNMIQRVFMTVYGIGENDKAIAVDAVAKAIAAQQVEPLQIFAEDATCANMLRSNWLRLTRGA